MNLVNLLYLNPNSSLFKEEQLPVIRVFLSLLLISILTLGVLLIFDVVSLYQSLFYFTAAIFVCVTILYLWIKFFINDIIRDDHKNYSITTNSIEAEGNRSEKTPTQKFSDIDFDERISQLNSLLISFALRLTRDRKAAEELHRETIIKAYRLKDKFSEGTNFKSWITTIMRNTFIDNYRNRNLKEGIKQSTTKKFIISDEGRYSKDISELQTAVNKLGDRFRVPFVMSYEGYEYAEIAHELGIPISTVKARIFIARQKLKNLNNEH